MSVRVLKRLLLLAAAALALGFGLSATQALRSNPMPYRFEAKVGDGGRSASAAERRFDDGLDQYANALVRIDAAAGHSFAEYAAFDLSMNEQTDREALVTRAGRWSYRELDRLANRAAHALAALGVRPGDRVAAALLHSIQLVPPLVQLVIANRRQGESRGAQRLDARLVVKHAGQER